MSTETDLHNRIAQLQRDLDIERRANARLRDQRRERIAGMVMAGLLAYPNDSAEFRAFARGAVRQADALIAELDKEGGTDGE